MEQISIIIPVFNAAKTIVSALDSVKNQSFGDFEILIVNDGSTDDSGQVISGYIQDNLGLQIRYFAQENRGVSAARNVGLKAAKGEFVALLDADDEWLPQKTERQMAVFNNDKNIGALGCGRNGKPVLWPYSSQKGALSRVTFRKLLLRNELATSGVVFQRALLGKSGFFNEDMRYAEDVEFWLRLADASEVFILNEDLLIHGSGKRTFGVSGLSKNLAEMHRGYLKILNCQYKNGRINVVELALYVFFYKLKYILLNLRVACRL